MHRLFFSPLQFLSSLPECNVLAENGYGLGAPAYALFLDDSPRVGKFLFEEVIRKRYGVQKYIEVLNSKSTSGFRVLNNVVNYNRIEAVEVGCFPFFLFVLFRVNKRIRMRSI